MKTRRTILMAMAAIPLSVRALYDTVRTDPLATLIGEYKEKLNTYTGGGYALGMPPTWQCHFDTICTRPPPIRTMSGALAAATMIREESTDFSDSPAVTPLARALEAFLTRRLT